MANKSILINELKKRVESKQKPQFKFEDHCFSKQIEFLRGAGPRFRTAVCSRRAGKCKIAGTLVKTPTGSVPIEHLRPGDTVYGYNSDGSISPCKVTALWDQGIKKVVDIIHNRQVVATSTLDHKWLAHNIYDNSRAVKKLCDFNSRDKIAEEYVKIPGGNKSVPEAYAIGALLGDGCSLESGICISSSDFEVVYKCASLLGTTDIHKYDGNFTWRLKGLRKKDKALKFYNLWCRNKKAHEKTCNLEEIRSWDRQSQIQFLSGLIDTDGSVSLSKDNRLIIQFGMQAKPIVEAAKSLILDLFQVQVNIKEDARSKYKNGSVFHFKISKNKFSKRILKELTTVSKTKVWKEQYEHLNENNSASNYVGIKLSKPYMAQCYDITVDNDTHLYMDANGLIGHNTVGIAADAIDSIINNSNVVCLYLTLDARSARNIIWGDVLKIIQDFELELKVDNTRLSVTNEKNGSKFVISGAKDIQTIEKYRGWKLYKAYIDECQSFRPYLKDLINDVITPALRDLRGTLYLTGTPGPVPAGPFYEYSHSDFWHNVSWTAFDNPHMHNPPDLDLEITLSEERIMKGITKDDPSYQRETYGIWIEDLDSLVFKYNNLQNNFDELPEDADWTYIFGIDIGWEDADAIAVLGYNKHDKKVYLVEEVIHTKQNITDLVDKIKSLKSYYKPVRMVMDAGALGKKINEEIRTRHQLPIEPADKKRKVEFIELLNDDLRTGKLLAKKSSRFAEDSMLVQWDKESIAKNPERPKISRTYHSDICDAVLYAWRECKHYLNTAKVHQPKLSTQEYMNQLEEKEAQKMEEKKKNPFFDQDEQIEKDMEMYSNLLGDDF